MFFLAFFFIGGLGSKKETVKNLRNMNLRNTGGNDTKEETSKYYDLIVKISLNSPVLEHKRD
jgi:hypothetical protein